MADERKMTWDELAAENTTLKTRNKDLESALKDLYFAGHWQLEDSNESKQYSTSYQISLWQKVKDLTGWSVTEGIQ